MQIHAFETDAGARDWVLLQFEPVLIDMIARQVSGFALNRPLILRPTSEVAARIDFLCSWLSVIAIAPDRAVEAERDVQLILILLANPPTDTIVTCDQPRPLSQALREVLSKIHSDPASAPGLAAAACRAGVTESHFSRQFRARVGMGFAAYVQLHRLNTAARLLVTGTTPVSQIAYQVGFATPAHFSKSFSDRFGLSPGRFRARAAGHQRPAQEIENE